MNSDRAQMYSYMYILLPLIKLFAGQGLIKNGRDDQGDLYAPCN